MGLYYGDAPGLDDWGQERPMEGPLDAQPSVRFEYQPVGDFLIYRTEYRTSLIQAFTFCGIGAVTMALLQVIFWYLIALGR